MSLWGSARFIALLPYASADTIKLLAAASLFSGLFPKAATLLLLFYPVALLVMRVNFIGRYEPGPITKPLQLRWAFTYWLPLMLLGHLVLCFTIYEEVPIEHPETFGEGFSPAKAFANRKFPMRSIKAGHHSLRVHLNNVVQPWPHARAALYTP